MILCGLSFVECERVQPLPVVKGELNQVETEDARIRWTVAKMPAGCGGLAIANF